MELPSGARHVAGIDHGCKLSKMPQFHRLCSPADFQVFIDASDNNTLVIPTKERLNKGLEHGRGARRFASPATVRDNRGLLGPHWASTRFSGLVADTLRALATQ